MTYADTPAHRQVGSVRPKKRASTPINWQQDLPEDWRASVVEALDFTEFREYEMPACRTLGHDEAGDLCFYAHRFTLTESRSDDDEDFYEAITYSETVRGWRLRDGRWLIYRIVQNGDEASSGRGFYSFSEQAPR
jgi:hypothetical protein